MIIGASLKKFSHTLAVLCKDLMTWIPDNFIKDFGDMRTQWCSLFNSLLSDRVLGHLKSEITAVLKVCSEESNEESKTTTFDSHFYTMLTVINKWFMKEIQSS